MKQSTQKKGLVWAAGFAVIATSFIVAQLATSHSNSPFAGDAKDSTEAYTYAGSSQDYTTVPHPWSLTYAGSGSDYRMRDTERHRRWESEERKDREREASKWARIEGITVASE